MNTTLVLNSIKKDLKDVEKYLAEYINFPHASLKLSSQHMLKAGGKRIRPAFVLLSGKVFEPSDREKLITLAAAVELIHMATLIHDDVIDQSEIRRGKPTMRKMFGDKYSLHAGDYLFAQALKLINPNDNREIANILSNASVEMCQGEIQQLISTFDTNQTLKNYFYRIKRKTALLIAVSCQIGALVVNAPEKSIQALYKYGYYLGMAFQIKDDILDISTETEILGKPVGSDLSQGIITLPTILVLKEGTAASLELKNIINGKFIEKETDLKDAISIIKSNHGIEKSLEISAKFIMKAKEQLYYLPKNIFTDNLDKLADYINEREL